MFRQPMGGKDAMQCFDPFPENKTKVEPLKNTISPRGRRSFACADAIPEPLNLSENADHQGAMATNPRTPVPFIQPVKPATISK